MTNPSPHNLQLRKWILDHLTNSEEFIAAVEDNLVDILGTLLTTRGDLLTRDGTGVIRLAKGAQNTLLNMGANDPAWQTLSTILDNVIGSTRGALLMRGSSGWSKIDPGTSGYFLKSNGAGADPSYQAAVFSASWTLISSVTANADKTFTGLSSYASIMVVGRALTSGSAGTRQVLVSTDNGSSYLNSSGDYISLTPSTGAEANASTITLSDGSTSARGFWAVFPNWNSAAAGKIVQNSSSVAYRVATATALNALKVQASLGPLTGGDIDVYGIPA